MEHRRIPLKYTDVSEVRTTSIIRKKSNLSALIRIIVAVRTSEKSIYFNETTRRYIPENCVLQFNMDTRVVAKQSSQMLFGKIE
jgi:hypothetical protein